VADPVVILGGGSFGAGELARLLTAHDGVERPILVSRSHAGSPVTSVHPHLESAYPDDRFVSQVDWSGLRGVSRIIVFSAMRAGELAGMLGSLETQWIGAGVDDRILLIDLSADFRLEEGRGFVYGLSEWMRGPLAGATRIANPGCFATALALGLVPLARELHPRDVSAVALTGSTGAGVTPGIRTHHPLRAHNCVPYHPFEHRHIGEVNRLLARQACTLDWSFIPYAAPWVRGISLTIEARFDEAPDQNRLATIFRTSYAGSPFVRWTETLPELTWIVGSNRCLIGGCCQGRRAALFVVLDNLVKGMAGQAIQNLNLASGWPEDRGLGQWVGPYPV
jgi:N-acetyl-gamma-glutamyl-phosphate reductase